MIDSREGRTELMQSEGVLDLLLEMARAQVGGMEEATLWDYIGVTERERVEGTFEDRD